MKNTVIAQAMLTLLNEWPDKLAKITLDLLDKPSSSMCLQQLSGTVVEKRYVDGSFIGIWPFAIYVRTNGQDTAQRIRVVKTLEALCEWMEDNTQLPNIGDNRQALTIEMTALPALAVRYEDGADDYQALFGLKYKQRSD